MKNCQILRPSQLAVKARRLAAVLCLAFAPVLLVAQSATHFPGAAVDPPQRGEQTAVLAGGCFWGVEAVFEALNGVRDVVSGYAGGSKVSANYRVVSEGTTGHAESVKITYDAAKISYGQLLRIFFAVAHDPTQLNRQGPDEGPQYRSVIFFDDANQKAVAEAYIAQLNDARVFRHRIVTTVTTLDAFYPAEKEHQDFVRRNPWNAYVLANDKPKMEHLARDFASLLKPGK
jgi:peptide-methionine (S)-S-oxide reductase